MTDPTFATAVLSKITEQEAQIAAQHQIIRGMGLNITYWQKVSLANAAMVAVRDAEIALLKHQLAQKEN